jgi:hypothetical protein
MDCHRGGTQKKKWFRKDRYKERKISPKANIQEPPGICTPKSSVRQYSKYMVGITTTNYELRLRDPGKPKDQKDLQLFSQHRTSD